MGGKQRSASEPRGPSPRRLREYFCRSLRLGRFLDAPGDGRIYPQIPAPSLLWSLLLSKVLRISSFAGVESLVQRAYRGFDIASPFGDDALAYFTERLDAGRMRGALLDLLRHARRNKVFLQQVRIGFALDGTGAGRSRSDRCELCHRQRQGYGHKLTAISVVGGGVDLPFDMEPYQQHETEVAAAERLLRRSVSGLGARFADYIVADALYAQAPFLQLADSLGLPVVVSLKNNLPDLSAAVRARFEHEPPKLVFEYEGGAVELWDADDFEPWGDLRWTSVRVMRYRQRRRDGKVFDACWLTNFTPKQVGSQALFRLAKSRWAIENHGFNDAKNRYGLEHITHHHPNSIVIGALLTCLAMCLERLYRLRNLHRGTHEPPTSAELVRILWLATGAAAAFNTS